MKAITDAGLLVGFFHGQDRHHRWAVNVLQSMDRPLLTCEAVLAETAFHLQSSKPVLESIALGMIEVAFDCTANMAPLQSLAERYVDRKPDLADLCLIRMSELYPKHVVITVDEADFRVYRRNKREVIPLLCPPRS